MKYIGEWVNCFDLDDGVIIFLVLEDGNDYLTSYYYDDEDGYVAVWYSKNDVNDFEDIKQKKVPNEMVRVIMPRIFED